MAGDIVLQLRDSRYPGQFEMRNAAADEIERLRNHGTTGQDTLRDQLAMAALQGHLAYSHYNESWGDYHNNGTHDGLAGRCYELADAMLKARCPQ